MATPFWAVDEQNKMQADADAKHKDDLTVWLAAAAQWRENGVRERDGGIPVPPFTRPVPERTVYIWNEVTNSFNEKHEPDPTIQMPVLPPPIAKDPGTPTIFQTGVQSATEAMLRAVLTQLGQMRVDVAAIKLDVAALIKLRGQA